jgi:hypothetical protein
MGLEERIGSTCFTQLNGGSCRRESSVIAIEADHHDHFLLGIAEVKFKFLTASGLFSYLTHL